MLQCLIDIRTHACMYVYTYKHTRMSIRAQTHTHTRMFTHTCSHTHVHTHHVCTHKHTRSLSLARARARALSLTYRERETQKYLDRRTALSDTESVEAVRSKSPAVAVRATSPFELEPKSEAELLVLVFFVCVLLVL